MICSRFYKLLLLAFLLCLPTLTLAQTVFDISGTIQGPVPENPSISVVGSVNFSGTFTLGYGSSQGTFTVSNWDISIPAIPLSNGSSLSALVFTPANSGGLAEGGPGDDGSIFILDFANNQENLNLQFQINFPFNINNGVAYGNGLISLAFNQNGAQDFVGGSNGGMAPSPVPEPPSAIFLATGLAGLALFGRKRLTYRLSSP
jgi:hypothetical protein